ncbi:MAG: sigma-70 family RNA polymerase sigma factor, partial [Pseudomonadota bacterium]
LLAAFCQGQTHAAQVLTDRHLDPCYGLALRMLGSAAEAEEVAQVAMLRLWRTAPKWRAGEARISTWLYRVTANLCTDRLRRRPRQVALDEAGAVPDGAPSAVATLEASDRQAALYRALDLLPERQRLAMVLRHLHEQSNPQVAGVMDLSVEAVESLLSRGKRGLRKALMEDDAMRDDVETGKDTAHG